MPASFNAALRALAVLAGCVHLVIPLAYWSRQNGQYYTADETPSSSLCSCMCRIIACDDQGLFSCFGHLRDLKKFGGFSRGL